MAIDIKGSTIGCSYYVAREQKLCLMQDIQFGGLDIVDTLKLHAQPTRILISTRSDEKLEEHLAKDARGIDRGDEASKLRSLQFAPLKLMFAIQTMISAPTSLTLSHPRISSLSKQGINLSTLS